MKNLIFTCAVAIIGFTSCSKENPQPETFSSKYKVEITHEGATEMYYENLLITIETEDGKQVELLGEDWTSDEIYPLGHGLFAFNKIGVPLNRTLETEKPIKSLFITETFSSKAGANEPVKTIITLYKDGALKTKKTHVFRGKDNPTIVIQ